MKHLLSTLLVAAGVIFAAFAASAADAPAKSAPKANETVAPGGGADKVWASGGKTYHCYGSRHYGKTKHGEYMSEADAKAKGLHPARNKPCTS
jgi:hypothetical protein